MEKQKVELIVANPVLAIFDAITHEFILQRPINRRVRQEMKYIIKQRNYEVVNKSNFTWL